MHDDLIDSREAMEDLGEPIEQAPGEPVPVPSSRPRIWTVFVVPLVGIVLAVGLQIVIAAVVAGSMVAGGTTASQLESRIMDWVTSSAGFLAMMAAGQVGFALPTLVAAQLSPVPVGERLGLMPLHRPVTTSVMMALGSILPLAISFALVYLVAEVIPPDPSIAMFFAQLTLGWGIAFVLLIALAPGFIEEMLFRGYIQRRLLQRWSPLAAIATTTLMFSLVHVTPHAMALAVPLGLWFGVIAWRTGSIIPTIVCHAFVNGGVNIWRLVIMFGDLSETTQLVGHVLFVLIGTVCFVIACRMLARYPATAPSTPGDELAIPAG